MKAIIYVLGENGYVWDADVAHWLRLECGLVGAPIGGVAAFKQQNAVHGLPLELSPEEVTLALERGWAQLQPALRTGQLTAALAGAGRKRARQPYEYAFDSDDDQDFNKNGEQAEEEEASTAPPPEPAWRAALADGSAFDIPSTPAEAAAANGVAAEGVAGADVAAAVAGVEETWSFPVTEAERHRYWVFRDLHAKGYRLTGGSKFGADYLLYPGDPTLYHAQFCVRLMPFDQPLLPAMLASATRGSHQARKHLLIASVVVEPEGEGEDGAAAAVAEAAEAGAATVAAAHGIAEGTSGSSEATATGAVTQVQGARQQAAAHPASNAQQQQDRSGSNSGSGAGAQAGLAVQPAHSGADDDVGMRIGANSGGRGSRGERFRIHYLTIGPVEGFG